MGKIKEILDGFNNQTLTNDEEFARLLDKNESSFVTYKAYNNFKEIATKRRLKASDILSFQENLNKTIENYDDSVISEAEEWCFLPGNGQKEGCPCLINVAKYIKLIKDAVLNDKVLKDEWDEKDRIRNEKFETDKKNYVINFAIERQKLDDHQVPNGCRSEAETFFKSPPKPVDMKNVYSEEKCGSGGYWQWYNVWTDDYKDRKMIEWSRVHTPVKDTLDSIVYPPKPEMQNQCCLNLITATDAAKVQNAKQLCQQTMINRKIIGDTESLEAIEIAKREEEEAAEQKAIEEEEKRIAEEAAAASDKKKKIFIILACVLLILGGLGIFLFISNGNAVVSTELKSPISVNSTP